MKKLFLASCFILALGAKLLAQDCATGYCPATITVHHKAGTVSPKTVDVTYPVVTLTYGTTKCWLGQNLGASAQPISFGDVTTANIGWYFNPNRKQGYAPTSVNNTYVAPNYNLSPSATGVWDATNDPCTLLLGSVWHVPTYADIVCIWNNPPAGNVYAGYGPAAYSYLKLNASDNLNTAGLQVGCGSWLTMFYTNGGTPAGNTGSMYVVGGSANLFDSYSGTGYAAPVRCVRDK